MKQSLGYCAWQHRARQFGRLLYYWLLLPSLMAGPAVANDLLIVYPEARSPYSKVFDDIITGVSARFSGNIHRLETTPGMGSNTLRERLKGAKPDIILALGTGNVELLTAMNIKTPIIAGAVRANPNNLSGISIFPDPVVVMEKLLTLSPATNRVFIVTASPGEGNYLEKARSYMEKQGKTLEIHRVTDIHEAAGQYLKVLNTADQYDGIWILPGETTIDNAIMGQLLQAAWNKNLVLFSANPNDVRKGTLFAAYPDNGMMGQDLGDLLNRELISGHTEPDFAPVKRLLLAVNVRTSRHLGLDLSGKIKSDIHLEL